MNALELLKHDHEIVKGLFEEAEAAEDLKEKRTFFKQIKKELTTHARIEEAVFYPAVEKYEELKDMVAESREEHKQVKALLKEITDLSPESEKLEPKLKVLMDNVEHHAEEEEEGEMFPKLEELMDEKELEELGRKL